MILNHLQSSETNFFVIIPTSNLRKTSSYYYKGLGDHNNNSYFRITNANGKFNIHYGYRYSQGEMAHYRLEAKVYVWYR